MDYMRNMADIFERLKNSEPQLTSHAKANMGIGNDKKFLIAIISSCLPFIGYPRSLNALNCIKQAYMSR